MIRFLTALTSSVIGKLVEFPLPRPLWTIIIKTYVKAYKVDLTELEGTLEDYPNLGSFFTRTLKPGARTTQAELVSPVDGTLKQSFFVQAQGSLLVKGIQYDLHKLIGEEAPKVYEGGFLYHFYLSPKDYHHIHFPFHALVTHARYIPGQLLPVNPLFCRLVPHLFTTNERVVIRLLSDHGEALMILVGALNVGKISTSFDADLVPKTYWSRQGVYETEYSPPHSGTSGARLGTFHLGSSVILVLSQDLHNHFKSTPQGEPRFVKVGQPI
jgi:phosphatidylserine decarboxylase